MWRCASLLVVLALNAILAVGCQAPGTLGLSAARPLTWVAWEGPEEFQAPDFLITPAAVIAYNMLCVYPGGATRSTTRVIGGQRDSRGLVQADIELDGTTVEHQLYDDQGRLIHRWPEPGHEEEFTVFSVIQRRLPDELRHRTLRRRQPVTFPVPLRELLGEIGLKGAPPELANSSATIDYALEYLGQTQFDGHVAGYQVRGRVAIEGGGWMTMEIFTYLDLRRRVITYLEMGWLFSGRVRGTQRPIEARGTCVMTLDAAASQGLRVDRARLRPRRSSSCATFCSRMTPPPTPEPRGAPRSREDGAPVRAPRARRGNGLVSVRSAPRHPSERTRALPVRERRLVQGIVAGKPVSVAARECRTPDGTTALAAFVFHRAGQPIGDFRKAGAAACEAAGVAGPLFHDLRRSAVRNFEKAGVSQAVAMKISGHKTASVYRRYRIVDEDDIREALERTAATLRQAPAATVRPLRRAEEGP